MKASTAIACLFLAGVFFECMVMCSAQEPTPQAERIHRKTQLVEQTAKQWITEGRNPSHAMSLMNQASRAFDGGDAGRGESLVDEALQALQRANASSNTSIRSQNLATNRLRFSTPEPLTLRGYSGPQQDPFISRDGQFLFFDTHDDIGTKPHLHYAKRIDYKTFQYIGQVPGTSQYGELQLEASEDSAHHFYFISMIGSATIIQRGIFDGRAVIGAAPVAGISALSPVAETVAVNMDLSISADGNTLYFTDAFINPQKGPQAAHSSVATRNSDGTFTRSPSSDRILKNINALSALVYNATISADNLMIAFNASPGFPNSGMPGHIYIAARSSATQPFGRAELIHAADIPSGNLSEPGSFSADGKYLYFHRVLSATKSQLYVLTIQR